MATVQTVINRSLRLLGVLASGETPIADETSDALTALNAMLDSWRNDKLMVYAHQDITVPLVASQASYTMGSSGANVTTTAPVKPESAYVRKSGVDYSLKMIDDATYQSIAQKTSASDIPEYLFFNHSYPNATIYLYPVPNEANNLYLRVWTPYSAFSAASDTFVMPQGYEDAIAYNLAVNLWPEFPGITLNPVVVKKAQDSLAAVKRLNRKPFIQVSQLACLVGGRSGNIIAGE